ncbi:hypothetical protein GCM10007170_46730 [Arthrobacter liuii]|uniref:Type I phosphodiesterase / nucleotide pyrophosphatase n=2 Tax=Arthrobacter liuii TaxID=1476996 RepID=A0ABQ2B1D6_9MICC|nr:hypothetical protein GCM10007170_46730 [Arthrobacter liuii]
MTGSAVVPALADDGQHRNDGQEGRGETSKHVLLLSVDGLHQKDLDRYVAAHPESALASLVSHGTSYTHAQTPVPSDSFPGMVGQLGEKNARVQLDALQAAGYDVKIAAVETIRAVSEARTLGRWERGYLEAENGTATGRDAELGGRWVPQSFPASLFTTPDAKESICAANAAAVATDYGCVSEYVVYCVADKDAGPMLETMKGRAKPGGPLVDSETLDAVRAASTGSEPQHRGRPQVGRDFGM